MCFVYGIERNLNSLEEVDIILLCERLRRNIQQLGLAGHDVALNMVDGRLVKRGVKIMSHPVALAHAVDHVNLILHQCNERRYHYCRAVHDERRQLITQRLSASGRHKHKRVLAIKQIAYNGFLVTFKLIKAEILLQFFCKINFLVHIVSKQSFPVLCYFIFKSLAGLSTLQLFEVSLLELLACIVESYFKCFDAL